jgi:uncharacterized protein YbaR (Trm112 family)
VTIRIWHSYSCNNSSSYRLVARFADAATAAETAAELDEFFEAQAKLGDHRYRSGALSTLSRTYGFDWQDGGAGSDGPHVCAEGEVLVVWHSYCLGLGPGLHAYLRDRGSLTNNQRAGSTDVQMSMLFRSVPGADPRLDAELEMLFAQMTNENRNVNPLRAPWSSAIESRGRLTCFRDAGTVGLQFPVDPEDLPAVKAWLVKHGIEAVTRLEEAADEQLFEILAAARCTACHGLLEYLDPRLHDIETQQLVCKPCGGLYDLSTFAQEAP